MRKDVATGMMHAAKVGDYGDEYGGGEIHVVTLWLDTDSPGGGDIAWLVVDAPADGDPTVVAVPATEDEALRLAEEAHAQRIGGREQEEWET